MSVQELPAFFLMQSGILQITFKSSPNLSSTLLKLSCLKNKVNRKKKRKMLKSLPIMILTYKVRNNLMKSILRNFSRIVCNSETTAWSTSFEHKCLLQQATIFNATQRSWLSKLTNVSSTKTPSTIAESVLDEIADIDDPERKEEVLSIIKLLISHHCSVDVIKSKCLPYIINTQCTYFKMKLLTNLHSDIVMLMPLLSCRIAAIRAAAKNALRDNNNIGFPNRIEYLSCNLEVKPIDLIPMLSKHPSLLTMPFKRLQYKMTILKQAQISSEDMVKDLWIFNYNEKLLENRISAALEAQVELKPWRLRCSEKFFHSILNKWVQTNGILKGDDEVSYLAKKLHCSEDYVMVLIEKNKLLKSINIPKIEQILNFLFDKGYTPQEVRLFPKIFSSSVQTLNKRFEDFRKIRATLPTMSQLCLSSKKFEIRKNIYQETGTEKKEN